MKQRQLQQLLYELVNLIMAVLFVLPFGIFFEQFFSFPVWRTAFLICFAVLGHLAGRFTLRAEANTAMAVCAISATAAVVLTAIALPSHGLGGIVFMLLVLVLSVLLFFMSRKAGYGFYTPMAAAGILCDLFLLVAADMIDISEGPARVLSLSACAFFLLSLYAFNSTSLRHSLHKGTGSRNIRYPSGMKINNFGMLTLFVVLAILISNIYPLFQGFSTVFRTVLQAIIYAMGFLSRLFDRRASLSETEEESSSTVVDSEDNIYDYEAKGEAGWITTAVEIFAMILVAILLGYLVYRAIKYLKARLKGMGGLAGRLRNMFAPPVEEDYIDEEESLFSWKDFWGNARDSIVSGARKLTERPQRIDDFPDDRMKIRFVYKQLLKTIFHRQPGCLYETPNEFQAQELDSDEDVTEFIAAYNAAKYADEPPSDDAVQAARRLLKRKF